jgi:hypothetical protein
MASAVVRTHVVMPKEVVDEIDDLVGPRRRRLLDAFDRAAGSLANVGVPGWETSELAAEWVRNLRRAGTRDHWADGASRE